MIQLPSIGFFNTLTRYIRAYQEINNERLNITENKINDQKSDQKSDQIKSKKQIGNEGFKIIIFI